MNDLFSTTGFIPRALCGNWTLELIGIHRTSDVLIWLSYCSIAACLLWIFAKRRRQLPMHWMLPAFGTFIVACGTTHLLDAMMFTWPAYRLLGLFKVVTMVASLITAMAMPFLMPSIFGWIDLIVTQGQTNLRMQSMALADAEARNYKLLAESLPDIVWTANAGGDLDYYNHRWYDYTGQTEEEAFGWGWEPVIHPDDLQGCLNRWAHSLSTGTNYEVKYRYKRHDGVYRWHLGRAAAVKDEAGKVMKWFGYSCDIHDQEMRAVYENNPKLVDIAREVGVAL